MDLQLGGKRSLVTGSTSGIGEAIAKTLAAEGAKVIVHGRRQAEAERVVHEIEAAGGMAALAIGDLASDEAAAEVVKVALAAFGGIDILVNNAGEFPMKPWLYSTAAEWVDPLQRQRRFGGAPGHAARARDGRAQVGPGSHAGQLLRADAESADGQLRCHERREHLAGRIAGQGTRGHGRHRKHRKPWPHPDPGHGSRCSRHGGISGPALRLQCLRTVLRAADEAAGRQDRIARRHRQHGGVRVQSTR